MAFHLSAFYGAVPTSTTAVTNINPVSDPVMFTSGSQLYLGTLSNLIGAYALGNTSKRSQVTTPSLLSLSPYEVNPIDSGTVPSNLIPLQLNPTNPIKLVSGEPLTFGISNDASSGNTELSGVVFLSDGAVAPVTGNIIRWRATATTSSTAGVWTNNTLTFSTSLAEGTYSVVGMRIEGAHAIAGRLVFQNSSNIRPGCIAVGSAAKLDYELFRNGNLGTWGSFTNLTPPTIDFLTDGTSETAAIYLDLIKTA